MPSVIHPKRETMPPLQVQRSEYKATPSLWWRYPGQDWTSRPPTQTWQSITDYVASELHTSRGHQVSKLGETHDDIGGDFEVRKREYHEFSSLGDSAKHFSGLGSNPYYSDPMSPGAEHHYFVPKAKYEHVATWANQGFTWSPTPSTDFQLNALGTTAISRIIPTNPLVSAAAFLGEMREGLPKLGIDTWSARASRAKSAGGDYLNAEFGWKPLISDVQKFAYIVKNSDRIIAQYEKDSGKLLRRSYEWPDVKTTEVVTYGSGHKPVPWGNAGSLYRPDHVGLLSRTRTTRIRRWLEATFTYYLPPAGSRARDIAIANKLYGVRVTPDVLWQLTPWSWAADWATNIGEVTSNVSAFMSDGLVMPYAYIMEEHTYSEEWLLNQVGFKSYPGMQNFRQTFTTIVKKRKQATPFGFGFDFDGLTIRQGAILAALGISRRK